MREIGLARDSGDLSSQANGGTIADLALLWRMAVNLHELRVINVGPESIFHRVQISPVAVCRELDPMSKPPSQVMDDW
jgi:hypothetical protein